METGLTNVNTLLLLELPYPSLLAMCSVNQEMNAICQHPFFWLQKIARDFGPQYISPNLPPRQLYDDLATTVRDFGPEALQYISPNEPLTEVYAALERITGDYNIRILEFKPPDQTLAQYYQSLSSLSSLSGKDLLHRRVHLINTFTDLMDQILSGNDPHRVLNVTHFDPVNIIRATTTIAPTGPRATAIRPVITVNGQQVRVPIIAQPYIGLTGLIGFLNSVVAYSRYAEFVPEILQSFQSQLQPAPETFQYFQSQLPPQ